MFSAGVPCFRFAAHYTLYPHWAVPWPRMVHASGFPFFRRHCNRGSIGNGADVYRGNFSRKIEGEIGCGRSVQYCLWNSCSILLELFTCLVSVSDNWRWMFGVMAIPAAIFFVLLFLVPESPRWLVRKNHADEARKVLQKVGAANVESELNDIVNSLKEEAGQGMTKLFQRKYNFVIMCAVLLAIFNQLSGINVIMYYAPMIFEKAGASTNAAMLQAVAVGVTNMVFTIIAMFFIDKFGRKTLLLIGAVGMFLSLAGAAFHYYDETLFGSTGWLFSS